MLSFTGGEANGIGICKSSSHENTPKRQPASIVATDVQPGSRNCRRLTARVRADRHVTVNILARLRDLAFAHVMFTTGYGRAAGEPVTLMRNDEPVCEHLGTVTTDDEDTDGIGL